MERVKKMMKSCVILSHYPGTRVNLQRVKGGFTSARMRILGLVITNVKYHSMMNETGKRASRSSRTGLRKT
jgi:hypothetical protein